MKIRFFEQIKLVEKGADYIEPAVQIKSQPACQENLEKLYVSLA